MTNRFLFPALLAMTCVACSTVYEGKYARDDGWRRGKVLEVAGGANIAQAGWRDCRKELSAAVIATRQFATVEFLGRHRSSTITVALPEAAHYQPGDQVYVNIVDCKAPVEARLQP